MVITGAGDGIMGAAQEGAGGEQSFGLNIRLPFEQEANPWIAADPKLITFKYFFTRKLFLVKEASALALFPGGFGTMDEAFEVLTLMQTGKAAIIPMVMVETGPKPYWRTGKIGCGASSWFPGLIEARDTGLLPHRRLGGGGGGGGHATSTASSIPSRIVGENLVFRLQRPLTAAAVGELQQQFADILKGRSTRRRARAAGAERVPELPRLILLFNRSSYARLRQLIDFVNSFGGRGAAAAERSRRARGAPRVELTLRADPGAHDDLGLIVPPQGPRNERRLPAPRTPLGLAPGCNCDGNQGTLAGMRIDTNAFERGPSPAPSCFGARAEAWKAARRRAPS